MIRTTRIVSLIALAAATLPDPAAAQGVVLKHELSIYADQKEVGLRAPEGVACTDSAVIVSDTGNGRLVRFALADKKFSAGVPFQLEEVKRPSRAKALPDGRLLVLDEKTQSIVRLEASGKFAGRVELKGDAAPKGAVPVAFDVDASGVVFVLDAVSRSVLAVDASGTVTRKVALPPDRAAAFMDVAVDPAGTLYAIDAVGAAVWSAPKGQAAFQRLSKSLKDYMSFPVALTVHRGSLIVVDQHGDGIVAVGLDGAYRGRQLAMGWGDGLVRYPSQLCVNAAGEMFVADRGNSRVQVFTVVR